MGSGSAGASEALGGKTSFMIPWHICFMYCGDWCSVLDFLCSLKGYLGMFGRSREFSIARFC